MNNKGWRGGHFLDGEKSGQNTDNWRGSGASSGVNEVRNSGRNHIEGRTNTHSRNEGNDNKGSGVGLEGVRTVESMKVREGGINSGNVRSRNRACGGRMRRAIGVSSKKGGLGMGSTKCGMDGSRGLGGMNSGHRASGIKNIPSHGSAGMNSGRRASGIKNIPSHGGAGLNSGRTGGIKNIPSRGRIGMNSGRRASGIKSSASGRIRSSASRG
jgi:hypothetical protein